jgi:P4 family phage/plasmid primase-like protien
MNSLLSEHRNDLRKSGLIDSTIRRAGIISLSCEEAERQLGFKLHPDVQSALKIPYFDINGEELDFLRVKVFPSYKDKEGHAVKYLQPKNTKPHLYMPPLIDYSSIAKDISTSITIIEGEKKTLTALQDRISALGIGGVWNWVKKIEGISKPIKDFDFFKWDGRKEVLIIGDSDVWLKEKEQALMGLYALGKELESRGVRNQSVRLVELPNLNSEKIGFDDFYMHYKRYWKVKFEELTVYPLNDNFPDYMRINQWYKKWNTKSKSTEQRKLNINGKPTFEPLLEARIFNEGKYLIFLNQQILMYQDGWYQEFDNRHYLKMIEDQIEEPFNGRRGSAKEILEVLKDSLYRKDQPINVNPKLINVRNGILNIDSLELLPHTPKTIFTYQINASYNPNAECEKFKKFLKEVLVKDTREPDDELIRLVQQFIGYCLYAATPFHECMMLYGVGRNGKSVLVFVIMELFKGLISQVHFEDIGEDKFATADLAGKLINVSSEFGVNAKISDGRIKGIIAGDELRAQRKHQPAFIFRPLAKHIITTNNLPRSKDKSLGFFSRFKIIPFHQIFLEQREINKLKVEGPKERYLVRDAFLEQELKAELDGIFLFAVNGLKDLLKSRSFCYSEQVEKLKNIFRIRCSSVESFIDERTDISDSTVKTELPELYRAYILYCKNYQIVPDSKKCFDAYLNDLGYEIKQGRQNKRFVHGIKL